MNQQVARRLRRIAWEYGKLGLLIDDSPECVTRVARALYGSDSLPPWWEPVRSIQCACDALAELHAIFTDPLFRSLRGLVLVDRYLPLQCGGQGGAVPWYGSEEVPREQVECIRGCVDRIVGLSKPDIEKGMRLGEESALLIRFLTSFPVMGEQNTHLTLSSGKSPSRITWQTRSTELLQLERRQCQESDDWRSLLLFGPQRSARIRQETPSDDLIEAPAAAAAKWRAETWTDTLQSLAWMFSERRRMILITGAGSSIRCSPISPGMLPTDQIVRRICREIREGNAGKGRLSGPGSQEPECACRPEEPAGATGVPKPNDDAQPGSDLSPIRRLIEQVNASPEGPLDFKLEEVCDRKKHKGSIEEFKRFHHLFRRELYRRDFGFAYHHWLMARFRWTAIITTNFDGFHERAAASVARMLPQDDETRLWALSLGSDRGEHRLFKPYGSLYSPSGELLLSNDEINAFQSEFRFALETALDLEGAAAPGAIVVVGHSMRDELARTALKDLPPKLRDFAEKFELVWVDPAAHTRCEKPQSHWEQLLARKKAARLEGAPLDEDPYAEVERYNQDKCSGPVPSRALDFIFDFWWHLQHRDEQ